MDEHFVISIGRQYGCGGRETGRLISEKLKISFYDKAILRMTADESGISECYFHLADEHAGGNLLSRIVSGMKAPGEGRPSFSGRELLKPDNLFKFQSEVIKELSREESFVIMGRCADMVLQDYERLIRVYLYADLDYRVSHVKAEQIFTEGEERKNILRMDRERNEYYRYYTGHEWGDRNFCDIMIDTSKIGIEGAADVIISYAAARGYIT
jgi:cytidylate kinase